jgi:hypothetical protein
MTFTVSGNQFSHDTQVSDALDFLRIARPGAYCTVRKEFTESIVWSGSWFDTEQMGVEPEYSSWLGEAIESTGFVTWWDGEPWAIEDGDELGDLFG